MKSTIKNIIPFCMILLYSCGHMYAKTFVVASHPTVASNSELVFSANNLSLSLHLLSSAPVKDIFKRAIVIDTEEEINEHAVDKKATDKISCFASFTQNKNTIFSSDSFKDTIATNKVFSPLSLYNAPLYVLFEVYRI